MQQATWWIFFTIFGIWAQRFVPGVDFLAPGLLLCLQEGRFSTAVQLTVIWIFLQEGMGSLAFGFAILWYLGLTIFYVAGRWLFESRNFFFVFFLGLCMGAWHVGLSSIMSTLQDLRVDVQILAREGALQAFVFTSQWLVFHQFYRRMQPDDRTL
jgi:hypothetical protein